MTARGAVLDANVLIPAALCDTLLRLANTGIYDLFWSADILEEVERNLVVDGFMDEDHARRRVMAMRAAFPQAMVEGYLDLIPTLTNSAKDRHVLAAGGKAGTPVIVTSNLSDFPPDALAPFGITAYSPDRFLIHLYRRNARTLRRAIRLQASSLHRPPLTVEDVLISSPSKHLNSFA
jgi:hypothetical protein